MAKNVKVSLWVLLLLWVWQLATGIEHWKSGDVTLGHMLSVEPATGVLLAKFSLLEIYIFSQWF